MNKTRFLMLVGVILLSLALVGMALAADNAQKPNPPEKPTQMTLSKPSGDQVDSLSGSFVAFDPSVGGDTTYIPGMAQTFCFRAESYTTDWNYVYYLWEKFPTDWTVTNAYVSGTPVCDSGAGWGTFGWSFVTNPYEVQISHARYQATTDHCVAYYCFDVVSGTGAPDALESWYWAGDDYGGVPHRPCSSDGYTPAGQTACDEAINPPAAIPPGSLDPVMLTPLTQAATGCNGAAHDYFETVWNNTGLDTTINLSYAILSGSGSCTGPDSVVLANGTTTDITVNLLPYGDPGTTVQCEVTAVDAQNPDNDATALLDYNVISGGLDPAGWMLETNTNAFPAQWQSCAVGTNPSAVGEVGYQVAGFSSSGTTQNYLQMYDPHAETWTQLAPAPDSYFGQLSGWINGKLYVAGGLDAAFIAYNDLEVYDPVTNSWDNTTPADLPVNRGAIMGGVAPCFTTGVGECLYSVGGTPDGYFTSFTFDLWEYDPLLNVWTQLTSVPGNPANYGMGFGGGVSCNGQIFAGGDYRGIADFFKFDTETGDWTQLSSIPATAGKMTPAMECVPGENAIYLIGGDSLGGWGDLYNNKVFRYEIATDTWTGPLPQTLNQGLLGSCGTFMAEKLFTFGGTNGSNAISPAPHESLSYLTCGPAGPLLATKTATPFILPGDVIDYAITINNTSPDDILADMQDAIPAGTTFVPGSLTCDTGSCSFDGGLNSVLWEGTLSGAVKANGGNVDSLTGSYVAFDPSVGGDSCFMPGDTETFCFRAESYTPDFAYVYNLFEKFPTDWTVSNVYVQGTPVCDSGAGWGTFGWSFQTSPNEVNIAHSRYQSVTDHCVAYYCFDVVAGTGSPNALESWYWTGDDYGSPPDHPCSSDVYTPEGYDECDEAVNPQAAIPLCAPTSTVNINFQAVADEVSCPSVVTNSAIVSSEGNPDAFASADTDVYCTLEPVIVVSPLSLFAEQPVDTITSQQLQICNEGPTPLEWSLTEVPDTKSDWVSPAPSTNKPFAINKSANVTRDPSVIYNPTKPTSEVLLDQAPNGANGIFIDAACENCGTGMQVVAENFALETTTSLEQIVFWTGYFPSDIPIDPDLIRVIIHQDAAGLPGTVVYDESNVSYSRSQTGIILFGVHEWVHTLTLAAPVALSAGNYWVEIYNTTGVGDNTNFFWEAGDPDTLGRGLFDSAYAFETPGVTWNYPNGYEMAFQLIGTIGPVTDIPWLSEDPTSGIVDPFACSLVDVSFNSDGLTPGLYTGELDVNSNDPVTPVVPVDVSLNVLASPDISVDPTSLTATLFPNEQQTQDLNVCNVGQSPLDWSLTEAVGMKVNSVTTVPAGVKPSHPVTLALDANGISAPTGPAPKTPNGDVALVLDDGSRDNDIGIGGAQEFIWVNRFTPNASDYPVPGH